MRIRAESNTPLLHQSITPSGALALRAGGQARSEAELSFYARKSKLA
jgi:hypothetical protein